ncbi:hypothetical protein PSPO01_12938 [Paraphaeosphaeria sporulosa]
MADDSLAGAQASAAAHHTRIKPVCLPSGLTLHLIAAVTERWARAAMDAWSGCPATNPRALPSLRAVALLPPPGHACVRAGLLSNVCVESSVAVLMLLTAILVGITPYVSVVLTLCPDVDIHPRRTAHTRLHHLPTPPTTRSFAPKAPLVCSPAPLRHSPP